MRIHAIIIALNEEDFITETIKPIYRLCSGISVITQYDRDYYGKMITPDSTVSKVLSYPDPEGKIHLVVRKYNDETASRNHEMMAMMCDASKGIMTHGTPMPEIQRFHEKPDYFLICDADEIYDINTFPAIVDYLKQKKPRGMKVSAYNYYYNWNRRMTREEYVHHHFGFIKAGLMFEQRRVLNWNESRLNKFFLKFGLKQNIGSWFFSFIDCPWEVGMLHHAGYIRRNMEKMREKMSKHSHLEAHPDSFLQSNLNLKFPFTPTAELPENIRNGNWPDNFFEKS
jgi:hypothetical protein